MFLLIQFITFFAQEVWILYEVFWCLVAFKVWYTDLYETEGEILEWFIYIFLHTLFQGDMLYPNSVRCMMYTCAIMETVCDMRTIINHLASLCLMMPHHELHLTSYHLHHIHTIHWKGNPVWSGSLVAGIYFRVCKLWPPISTKGHQD